MPGIFHVRNRGKATWYCWYRVPELLGLPGSSQFRPPVPPRPQTLNSLLSTRRFNQTTGKLMPSWQISLESYLKEYLVEQRKGG